MLDSVLQEILTELQNMNAKLGDIREELTDIKQAQGDDALSVVAAKLDELIRELVEHYKSEAKRS